MVLNLNQQSESSDLIGGFKPVELRLVCGPLKDRFEVLFKKSFSEQVCVQQWLVWAVELMRAVGFAWAVDLCGPWRVLVLISF